MVSPSFHDDIRDILGESPVNQEALYFLVLHALKATSEASFEVCGDRILYHPAGVISEAHVGIMLWSEKILAAHNSHSSKGNLGQLLGGHEYLITRLVRENPGAVLLNNMASLVSAAMCNLVEERRQEDTARLPSNDEADITMTDC